MSHFHVLLNLEAFTLLHVHLPFFLLSYLTTSFSSWYFGWRYHTLCCHSHLSDNLKAVLFAQGGLYCWCSLLGHHSSGSCDIGQTRRLVSQRVMECWRNERMKLVLVQYLPGYNLCHPVLRDSSVSPWKWPCRKVCKRNIFYFLFRCQPSFSLLMIWWVMFSGVW